MTSLSTPRVGGKRDFAVIADSFLHDPGLPFASVLDSETIARVFREEEALFGQEDIFSTQMVLWAFLAQTLRDGKGVACAAAVADIATYLLQTGRRPPSGDTGAYCRARAKLKLTALQRLVRESGGQLEHEVEHAWLWKGRHAKLVDGFPFTRPDTPENQAAFPQIAERRSHVLCADLKNTGSIGMGGRKNRPEVQIVREHHVPVSRRIVHDNPIRGTRIPHLGPMDGWETRPLQERHPST